MQLRTHAAALGYNPLSATSDPCPVPPPFRTGQVLAWTVTSELGKSCPAAGTQQPAPTPASTSASILDAFTPDGEQEVADLSSRWETDPEHKWIHGNHPDMTPAQKEQLKQVLLEEQGAFAYTLDDLSGYTGDLGPAELHMKNDKPVWSSDRNFSPLEKQIGRDKVSEMLQAGIIEEAATLNAQYASAVTMPAKRAPDGSWSDKRFCVDLRGINNNSVVDRYKMPLPDDLFKRMQGATWRSKIDCRSGFFNIPLSQESQNFCAFWWEGKLYRFTRLPFGHVNATAIFQRIMEHELQQAGLGHCSVVFVDDVCIYSCNFAEHLQCLRLLLRHFQAVGLKAHPSKSIFCSDSMPFLGHVVSADGIHPDQAKVAAMQALPQPTSADQVRSYLGVLGFYRCYVPNYSSIAAPLNALLKKNIRFDWTPECDAAYTELKSALTTPGLALHHPDPDLPFHLFTDWSVTGIAAVLNQRDKDGNWRLVAAVSRSLSPQEKRYEAWRGEALAAVYGVKMLRSYLWGVHFYLHTDHRALLWILTQKEPVGQTARWVLSLQDHTFSLVHRPGAKNPADAPSRYPQATTVDPSGARMDKAGEEPCQLLPPVLQPDLAPDATAYTAAMLTQLRARAYPQPSAARNPVTAALLQCGNTTQASVPQLLTQLHDFSTADNDFLDAYAPTPAALLAGNNGSFTDAVDLPPDTNQPAAVWRQEQLDKASLQWVHSSQPMLDRHSPSASLAGSALGEPDSFGVRNSTQLRTRPVASTLFPATAQGIVLLEPFGGLCAGLEMALRNGTAVKQYLYLDTNATSRQIAAHRMQQLMALYPLLLPASAIQNAFSLPQDIRQLTTSDLITAGATAPKDPWLVVAGWPCQDLSLAGTGAGLQGERSGLLQDLVRVIGALQQLQPEMPPGYIIENVAMQFHNNPTIAQQDFMRICSMIGQPTVLDAAQFGSLAHRVRNFWTNLCTPAQLRAAAAQVPRPANRTVSIALGPGRYPQQVQYVDRPPRYCCNKPGEPMTAWPTFMAHPGSYAFRPGQPGSVTTSTGEYDQPTAAEREFALGYANGSTAAPGVSEQQRRTALGECMDSHCMQCLYAITRAWWRAECPQQCSSACMPHLPAPSAQTVENYKTTYKVACALVSAAAAQEVLQKHDASHTDIWLDMTALHLLQQGSFPSNISAVEKSRVNKRLQYYSWRDGKVLRLMPDNSTRVVPPPSERFPLIKKCHDQTGHFGIRRTTALLLHTWWWHGIQADAASVVSACKECSRVRATFNAKPAELQPLPIKGLMYRWGVDLAGPFPETARGHKYLFIAVEHFSKHIIAVPIADKTPECTTYAFLYHVLSKYGAMAECCHDRGGEWAGAFEQLLLNAKVDSRSTSANHPAANGAAEKSVHIVKTALKKMCLQHHNMRNWDMEVPWLLLGYNCSPQRSTGYSPYELLFAHAPVVPPATADRMREPIDFDSPAAATTSLLQRRELAERICPEAMSNLQIAQHRDTLRYAHIRSGTYEPKHSKFEVGDFVYTAYANINSTLQPRAKPVILRVNEVRPSGRLILQGRCGRTTDRHMSQCAPCHLPGIDPNTDPTLADKPAEAVCEACSSATSTQQNPILLCDYCDAGWHMLCLEPPLAAVPNTDWLCPRCVAEGITAAQLQSAVAQRDTQQAHDAASNLFPDKAMRQRDAVASQLHGRLVKQNFIDPSTKKLRPFWGKLHYMGDQRRPRYFDVHFEDGDVYQYTTAEVKKHLQPRGSVLPAGITLPNGTMPVGQPTAA
eukprot:GHRQ01002908.1.p1 GENE.GHRQ01002908.1~~GHRQ01002908.1.p1  ORF type:complete len:1949 (-),score=411.99 GHRQ01002908.1:1876-7140(-)